MLLEWQGDGPSINFIEPPVQLLLDNYRKYVFWINFTSHRRTPVSRIRWKQTLHSSEWLIEWIFNIFVISNSNSVTQISYKIYLLFLLKIYDKVRCTYVRLSNVIFATEFQTKQANSSGRSIVINIIYSDANKRCNVILTMVNPFNKPIIFVSFVETNPFEWNM